MSSSGIQVHDLDTLGLEQRGKPQCTEFVGNIDYFVFFLDLFSERTCLYVCNGIFFTKTFPPHSSRSLCGSDLLEHACPDSAYVLFLESVLTSNSRGSSSDVFFIRIHTSYFQTGVVHPGSGNGYCTRLSKTNTL